MLVIGWIVVSARRNAQKRRQKAEEERIRLQKLEEDRRAVILAQRGKWPDEMIDAALNKNILIRMRDEMVLAAWGKPTTVEHKETTAKGKKTRWIYGVARQGAQYLWFTNEELTKIQN